MARAERGQRVVGVARNHEGRVPIVEEAGARVDLGDEPHRLAARAGVLGRLRSAEARDEVGIVGPPAGLGQRVPQHLRPHRPPVQQVAQRPERLLGGLRPALVRHHERQQVAEVVHEREVGRLEGRVHVHELEAAVVRPAAHEVAHEVAAPVAGGVLHEERPILRAGVRRACRPGLHAQLDGARGGR